MPNQQASKQTSQHMLKYLSPPLSPLTARAPCTATATAPEPSTHHPCIISDHTACFASKTTSMKQRRALSGDGSFQPSLPADTVIQLPPPPFLPDGHGHPYWHHHHHHHRHLGPSPSLPRLSCFLCSSSLCSSLHCRHALSSRFSALTAPLVKICAAVMHQIRVSLPVHQDC